MSIVLEDGTVVKVPELTPTQEASLDDAPLASTREAISSARLRIEMERAFTVDRIDRFRRFARGEELKKREREEWGHFHDRVRPLELSIEAMTKHVANYIGLQAPPPMLLKRTPP